MVVAAELFINAHKAIPNLKHAPIGLREEHAGRLQHHRAIVVVGHFLGRRAEGNRSRSTDAQSMLAADCGDHHVPLNLVVAKGPMRIGLGARRGRGLECAFRQDAVANEPVGDLAGNLGLRLAHLAIAAGRFDRVCRLEGPVRVSGDIRRS